MIVEEKILENHIKQSILVKIRYFLVKNVHKNR